MKKATQCVHSGTFKDQETRGVNTPIFTSTSFNYLDASENIYPRYFNTPNQRAIIEKLCALEGAEAGLLFSSGMAAISSVLFALLNTGDHAIIQRDIYGGTYHFATAEFERFGISYSFTDNTVDAIERVIQDNTRLILIESPSNPLLKITDIRAVAELARSRNIITVIDNTFASPIGQNPLLLGIDIVVHSGTKYLGGHSDLCCGAAVGSKSLILPIRKVAMNFGGSLNASECYLLERSMKTLGIRMQTQCNNAQIIAEALAKNPKVAKVYYPGLGTHPGHALAQSQMSFFGAVVSFELDAREIQPSHFIKQLKLINPAVSLGGVESIICSPAVTSHAKLTDAERADLGITDSLFRLSVGIEDSADLVADIERALGG